MTAQPPIIVPLQLLAIAIATYPALPRQVSLPQFRRETRSGVPTLTA